MAAATSRAGLEPSTDTPPEAQQKGTTPYSWCAAWGRAHCRSKFLGARVFPENCNHRHPFFPCMRKGSAVPAVHRFGGCLAFAIARQVATCLERSLMAHARRTSGCCACKPVAMRPAACPRLCETGGLPGIAPRDGLAMALRAPPAPDFWIPGNSCKSGQLRKRRDLEGVRSRSFSRRHVLPLLRRANVPPAAKSSSLLPGRALKFLTPRWHAEALAPPNAHATDTTHPRIPTALNRAIAFWSPVTVLASRVSEASRWTCR